MRVVNGRWESSMRVQESKKKWLNQETKEIVVVILNKYSLFFQWILSLGLCFYIEAASRHSVGKAYDFFWDRSWVFLYNSLIIFATMLVVYLFKRRALVRVLISGIWLFLGTINGCVLAKRVTPFGYTDLKMIQDLFTMKSNYYTPTQIVLAIIGLSAFTVLSIYLWKKGPRFQGNRRFLLSFCMVSSTFIWLPIATNAAVNSHLLTNYFSNIAQGYEKYGFVYGFSTSVVDRGMSEPEGYSQETIEEIKNQEKGSATTATSEHMPNIILVLLESFVDPGEINFLECSEDPIPNFRKLSENYSSGYLEVPVIGAGTANTEFEILTGMNLRFFGTGEYPYKTVLKDNTCESIAGNLNGLGYGTHVIHNNGGNFYSRAHVFSQMGFDSFTSEELMNIRDYNPLHTWAKDDILLGEVEKALDATPDQKDFIYTITVQSHGDYPREKVINNPLIKVTGAQTQEENYAWEYYVNQIHETDAFIGNLVEQLNQRDEDTLVILFGDHLPTMGLETKDMKSGNIFKTRYATWNNFGLPKEDAEIYSFQLLAEMTKRLGIHEGTMFRYHQNQSDSEAYTENMEQLQYDILYGDKYFYGEADLYPASELEMGVVEVVLTRAMEGIGEKVYIQGENFTPWSKVFVNGEKVNTKYDSSHQVIINSDDVQPDDVLVVNQMGSKSTIFRSSNEVVYSENQNSQP